MTVFVSTKQGTGKSTMGRALVPDEKWFAERIKLGAEPKELVLLLAGKMICEVSEMGTKGQVNDVKSMLSAQSDEGRPAYARSVQDRPRRNIFIGSTNHTRFLVDETGNRRFLPVILKQAIDIEWIEANRDQLIGEAAVMHSAGEKFRVPPEMYDICAQHQERARLQSPEELIIEEELAPNSLCPLMFIRGAALEKLCIAAGFKGTKDREPMMTRLGFKHHDNSKRIHGTQSKVWIRDTRDQPNEDMRTAVEFIVDTTTADKFPKVTLREPAGPSSMGKPGAPAMPPQTPEAEEPWVRPGNNNLFDNRPPPPPEPTKH
jgi:predicted P-loop ATPase